MQYKTTVTDVEENKKRKERGQEKEMHGSD
jgi:hypothetical protein